MTDEETQEIYRLVHELGGVEKAQELATHYTEKALKEISKLPETKAQAKEQLYEITQTILTREIKKPLDPIEDLAASFLGDILV